VFQKSRLHEIPLYDLKITVWWAMNVCKIIWPMLLEETINSHYYCVHLYLTPFFKELTEQEKCTVSSCIKMPWSTERTPQWLPYKRYLANS
jgi:hypothetical protein